MILKRKTQFCIVYKKPTRDSLKNKTMRSIYHVLINQKKACVALLILYKKFIRTRNITMDKDEYFIMTKDSMTKDIIMYNVYAQIINC